MALCGALLNLFLFRTSPARVTPYERDWNQYKARARQLLEAIKGMGPAEGWPYLLGNVALNWGVRPRSVPWPNPQSPEIYSGFVARILDFAVFPHLSRQSLAAAAGLGDKGEARDWIQEQIHERVRKPE